MVLFRFDVSTLALTSKPPNRPESMRDPPERGGHHCVLNELGDWAGRREKIVKRRFRRWQMGVGQWWMGVGIGLVGRLVGVRHVTGPQGGWAPLVGSSKSGFDTDNGSRPGAHGRSPRPESA